MNASRPDTPCSDRPARTGSTTHRLRRTLTGTLLALGLASLPLQAQPVRSNEPVTLNFVGAEIEAVARTMATITGRNVVVDPRVQGQITLATDRPVTPAAAVNQFAAALRLQGFSLVDTGGLYKVVPEADAKLMGSVVVGTGGPGAAPNTVVTQIFRLNHESANNLVPVLRPLIGPNNTINVNPGNNSLVITDYVDNLQRIGRIIASLDVAGATDIEIIPLQHALAADLVPLVQRLIEPGSNGGGGGGGNGAAAAGDASYRTTIVAEPRSNSLVLRAANPARLALVRSLVTRLDQPTAGAKAAGNIHVVYLKNANAVALAATLRAAMSGGSVAAPASGGGLRSAGATSSGLATSLNTGGGFGGTGGNGGIGTAGSGGASAPLQGSDGPSTGGQIQADPATNSLIITAPEPQYRQLRAVIDQLDSRRAQVYVESLIAEVNADKAAEFGIQWQGASGRDGDRTIGLLGTNFGSGGRSIVDLSKQDDFSPAPGLNLGIARRNNGVYVLGFLARFLQQNGDGNILSTPNLLTLDNEEARIVIGQNVPFVTGQFTNTGAANGAVNPFQTIERKDVGLTLRVRPQISENGTIKMTIYQEVSNVQPQSVNSPTGLITNVRSIESTVLVDDGAIVVLGGLLQDEYAGNQDKVPGLGDVPLLGNLFRNESRSRRKTNLMVFLRPVVMRDSRETTNLALDRYDLMRAAQRDVQPANSSVLPINEAPVLPPPTEAPKVRP
ncbi:type II secretion system secretin GspD [uncultured Hydrogenophaga sp.]|uniref:type II secretion system secretin GspD n=1 Tax=uncultured Hydrogenophaga sp. TaxID=199683 RepID=UPI00265E7298|nr:type II secretion system secretin GspD [uncultured Hydrogenophaga sp.]